MIGQTTPEPDSAADADPAVEALVAPSEAPAEAPAGAASGEAPEFGGRDGPDPTRYGDWEKNGRCIDF